MKFIINSFLFSAMLLSTQNVYADTIFKFSKNNHIDEKDTSSLEQTFISISNKLPLSVKKKLPRTIFIKVTDLNSKSGFLGFPEIKCFYTKTEIEEAKSKPKFTYATYGQYTNTLTLDKNVAIELIKGEVQSKKISCQHGSLYKQSVATIIHELTHAYDVIHPLNTRISDNETFLRLAGFKPGLLSTKLKNTSPLSSPDIYEIKNPKESFAVNMEYFLLDPDFSCKRPSMYNFLRKKLNHTPFPSTKCKDTYSIQVYSGNAVFSREIKLSDVYRVDYLIASKGNGMAAGFGHSMFRLAICKPETTDLISQKMTQAHKNGPICLHDNFFHIVVSYRANLTDTTLSYWKALTGGYPSKLFMLDFSSIWDEYNNKELRALEAYPLKLSEEEKNEFVLQAIESSWNYQGDYNFISNNCAIESQDLIKSSLATSNHSYSKSALTPYGLLKDLTKAGLIEKHIKLFDYNNSKLSLSEKISFINENPDTGIIYRPLTHSLIKSLSALNLLPNNDKLTDNKLSQCLLKTKSETLHTAFTDSFSQHSLEFNSSNPTKSEMILLNKNYNLVLSYRNLLAQTTNMKRNLLNKKLAATLETPGSKDLEEKRDQLIEKANKLKQIYSAEQNNYSYGVLNMNSDEVNQKILESNKELQKEFEDFAKEVENRFYVDNKSLIDEIKTLETLYINSTPHYQTLKTSMRKHLKSYVENSIQELANTVDGKTLLIRATQSESAIQELREVLNEDLVTTRAYLDQNLIDLINNALSVDSIRN